MNRKLSILAIPAAAIALTLSACGGPSLDDALADKLPNANLSQAQTLADQICDDGLFAAALKNSRTMNSANDQTGSAVIAYTLHQCKDDFLNDLTDLEKTFNNGTIPAKDQRTIAMLKQVDSNDVDQLVGLATSDSEVL